MKTRAGAQRVNLDDPGIPMNALKETMRRYVIRILKMLT